MSHPTSTRGSHRQRVRTKNERRRHRWIYGSLGAGLAVFIVSTVWLGSFVSTHSSISQWDALERLLQDYVHKAQILSNVHGKFIPRADSKEHLHQTKPPTRPAPKNQDKPLNILLLYADDWRHDSLGVAGNSLVKTPFLDRLARDQGIRFTQNCVTTSICWMSRATLHTGLYASKHHGWMPDQPYWYHHWFASFPYLLKTWKNYAVAHVGKWDYQFFHDIPALFQTYQYSRMYQYQHWYTPDQVEAEIAQQTHITGQPRYPSHYKTHRRADGQDHIHVIDRTVHDALEFLEHRPKDQPFMLTVAFFPPHAVVNSKDQFYPQPGTAVC